jgi:uncharacterized protein (DUF1015 family)
LLFNATADFKRGDIALRIHPFRPLRPSPETAPQVAAPPYDTVDTAEARQIVAANPTSFLRVSRAEVDFPEGVDETSAAVYQRGAENLRRYEADGLLRREDAPSLYVYRQRMGSHVQRGVTACCHVRDYERNLILKHERTRKDKEDDRTTHLRIVGAHSGPVFLAYRDRPEIDALVRDAEAGPPLLRFTAPDGIEHAVWRVAAPAALARAFESVPVAYIADGHHRAAAAARLAAERRAGASAPDEEAEVNWFLAVLFPASQLQILPYNRLVRGLNGLTPAAFVAAVRAAVACVEAPDGTPAAPREARMYLAGRWYRLNWPDDPAADPVASLDVSRLQNGVFAPILGVQDPRTDKRLEFLGGIRGLGELTSRVHAGRADVAFSMFPVTVDQMMRIADAGAIMPPKSTWFEPKLRSGLFVHTF